MSEGKNYKCGMVSIVGRPNVGKSTLLNKLVGEKVAITSKIPQTTRQQIRGIYSDERGQIIFIDTPGLHKGRDKLDHFMNQASDGTIDEADCLIYCVDTLRRIGEEEEFIVEKLAKTKTPVILAFNKVDINNGKMIPDYIQLWERAKGSPVTEIKNFAMLPISSDKGTNMDQLLELVFEFLPVGPALYPTDVVTDIPQKLVIADTIREKLLHLLKDEVPHAIGVVVEHMAPRKKNTLHIKALIFVERETQKEIVIGKNGHMLKKVGTSARLELEDLMEQQIYLELFVKVQSNWRDDAHLLRDFGLAN